MGSDFVFFCEHPISSLWLKTGLKSRTVELLRTIFLHSIECLLNQPRLCGQRLRACLAHAAELCILWCIFLQLFCSPGTLQRDASLTLLLLCSRLYCAGLWSFDDVGKSRSLHRYLHCPGGAFVDGPLRPQDSRQDLGRRSGCSLRYANPARTPVGACYL